MKTVIVTGGTKGFGLAVTRKLLSENYRVISISRTTSNEWEDVKLEFPNHCFFEAYNMSNTEDIHSLANRLRQNYGRVYGLVNNAALGYDGVLATMHETEIGELLKVNIEAPILLTKYLVRPMLLNQIGRIINISSIIASTGFKGLAVYAATKAAMEGFTKSLCRELGKANITINNVAPGYMETNMTQELQRAKLESIKRRSPLGRLVSVNDGAEAVSFLLSEGACSITGTTITVDAGSTA